MTYAGQITDRDTSEPIPFASVSIVSPVNTLYARVIANAKGEFFIDSPAAMNPNLIVFTSTGYKSSTFKLTDFDDLDFNPALVKSVTELPGVTVTAGKKGDWGLMFFLIGLAVTVSQKK